jgi:hypothetical protein
MYLHDNRCSDYCYKSGGFIQRTTQISRALHEVLGHAEGRAITFRSARREIK